MISLLGATLFGIEIPDTVMDIINIIEKICVVLMPVILAVGGVILSTIKRNNAKAELADKEKIAALDAVANRENVKPQIDENTKTIYVDTYYYLSNDPYNYNINSASEKIDLKDYQESLAKRLSLK